MSHLPAEAQAEIYEWHTPRIEAKRKLKRAYDGEINLTLDAWHDLTFLATGSKELAEEAYRAAASAKHEAAERSRPENEQ